MTGAFIDEFVNLGGDEAAMALRRIGEEVRDQPEGQFEALLGPLESLSGAIDGLLQLTSLERRYIATLDDCGQRMLTFASRVHEIGMSIVLSYVARHGVDQGAQPFDGVVMRTCRTLVEQSATEESHLTVGTLNYDGLLSGALLRLRDEGLCSLSDLGRGFPVEYMRIAERLEPVRALRLRPSDDLIGNTHLLQLHGSLGWLSGGPEDVWKFELEGLRYPADDVPSYWELLRDGHARLLPKVVLTDRKGPVVSRWPFSLAYALFESRLVGASKWLIAGYGFGDEPVNETFRRALAKVRLNGRPRPEILVVDTDGNAQRAARTVFGDRFTFDDSGLPEALTGDAFVEWSAA